MLYREAGQFKSTYAEDQQIFPIRQDRIALAVFLAFALLVVPVIGNQYWLAALLTPFLIFSLAALGLNILTGYAGQLSLGTRLARLSVSRRRAAPSLRLRRRGLLRRRRVLPQFERLECFLVGRRCL